MKVAIIARSTLYTVPGGDTVQALQTAKFLACSGIDADVLLSNSAIVYEQYNLLHFFNITRPADMLYHSKKAGKPFVVSTILVNYSEYDKNYREGIGKIFSYFTADNIEYLKTVARWLLGRDHLSGISYLWKGQRRSIVEILKKTAMILPNSTSEYNRLINHYSYKPACSVVPNGVNPALFNYDCNFKKNELLVLCVARIEGRKNQLGLIQALNNTRFKVLLIGSPAPNQNRYYRQCRNEAAANISFINHVPQKELVKYYQQAKVHVLPSWFETTGLSSIEAGVMGCNLVITDKGDTAEYFGNDAFYCDPSSPKSILKAVEQASIAPPNVKLRKRILEKFTWEQAALQTRKAYQSAISI